MCRVVRLEPRETGAGPVQGTIVEGFSAVRVSTFENLQRVLRTICDLHGRVDLTRACQLRTRPPMVDCRIRSQADQMGRNVGGRVTLSRLAELEIDLVQRPIGELGRFKPIAQPLAEIGMKLHEALEEQRGNHSRSAPHLPIRASQPRTTRWRSPR